MTDSPKTGSKSPDNPRGGGVDALASTALSMVASRGLQNNIRISPVHFDALMEAALGKGDALFSAVIDVMHSDGISSEQIADGYVPALARKLGDQWCEDSLSFAEVTIGTSRLQSLLRLLGPEWRADWNDGPSGAAILVAVPEGAFHTLGAILLSGQLRRLGFSVRLRLDAKPRDLANIVAQTSFEAMFLSASKGETLEKLRALVNSAKTARHTDMPVVLGGSILEREPEQLAELAAQSGVDHMTRDLKEALNLCGLTTPNRGAKPSTQAR